LLSFAVCCELLCCAEKGSGTMGKAVIWSDDAEIALIFYCYEVCGFSFFNKFATTLTTAIYLSVIKVQIFKLQMTVTLIPFYLKK
jgi:hypothetical protein